jgi:hypothetical protein
MKNFQFTIDTECTAWHRHTIQIKAETKAEALSKAINMAEFSDVPENAIYQYLEDTTQPTGLICILDEDGDEAYNNHTTTTKIYLRGS